MKYSQKLIYAFEAIPFGIAIFCMLLFQKTSPILSGGEEQYLAYAKQAMDPEWIKKSISLTEKPGSRLLFQWIVGTGLKFMSFEVFTIVARIFNYLLYAFALHSLFNKLKLPKLWTLVAFQIYILGKQNFFAGEWIFESFEPKTLAYAFLFFSLRVLLDRKIILAAFLLAIGTYFHFIVTGWFAVCLGIYWLCKQEFKTLLHFSTSFTLFVTPLVIYLYETILKNSEHFINGVNLNWAYCYGRLYHHLGIAISWDYFVSKQLLGIVTALGVGLLLIRFKDKTKALDLFSFFTIIAISLSLFFVLFAIYDSFILNQYASFPLKTYPFRPMALAQFFSFLVIAFYLNKKINYTHTKSLLSICLLILFVAQSIKNYSNYSKSIKRNHSFAEMNKYIVNHTSPNAVFHLELLPYYISESFIRKTERDAIYIHKFIPAESNKQYQRCVIENELGALNEKKLSPVYLKKKYGLDYIVSVRKLIIPDTRLVTVLNDFFLYEIKKNN